MSASTNYRTIVLIVGVLFLLVLGSAVAATTIDAGRASAPVTRTDDTGGGGGGGRISFR